MVSAVKFRITRFKAYGTITEIGSQIIIGNFREEFLHKLIFIVCFPVGLVTE